MDLITQGLLGATVAQAGYQKKLGKKAIGFGAIVGMLPDADVLHTYFSSHPFADMLYHRGFTHSLWFAPLMAPILGYLLWRLYKGDKTYLSAWVSLCFWALITHPLLDVFTVYGTQLLAPFSNHRFVIPGVSIVDPFYSVPLLLSILIGLTLHKKAATSQILGSFILLLTSGYLFFCVEQNEKAKRLAQNQLTKERITDTDIRVYTTLMQPFLRRVVVHRHHDVWIGYVSTWGKPKEIQWHKVPHCGFENNILINSHENVVLYRWFTGNEMIFTSKPLNQNSHQVEIFDSRYGFIGESILGFWALKGVVKDTGEIIEPFKRTRLSTNLDMEIIKKIYQKAFNAE